MAKEVLMNLLICILYFVFDFILYPSERIFFDILPDSNPTYFLEHHSCLAQIKILIHVFLKKKEFSRNWDHQTK